MTNTVLLTGGFGNVGGRLSSLLAKTTDIDIRLSSRIPREAPPWAKRATVVTCDVTHPASLDAATTNIDTIFHFASLNDRQCAVDPKLAHEVNVTGTKNLVESAIRNGVRRFVYMSTIHVYGSPLIGRINEDAPTKPTHPYGLTHLEAEQILHAASSNIQHVVIRSGNGFGYPMSLNVDIWHIIVNDLCTQAIKHGVMTLKSPPNIERNFITLHDICRGLLHVKEMKIDGSATFNLGSKQSRTLRQMADLIATRCRVRLSRSVEIVESLPAINDDTSLDFDTSRIRQTGFETIEDFETEIDGILDILTLNHGS